MRNKSVAAILLGLLVSTSAMAVCYKSSIGGKMLCCDDAHTVCEVK